jgi:hypothetical protein
MSPRKRILRELSRARGESGSAYTRPSTIPGFSRAPDRYQRAVNELLKDRLLEGRPDEEGRMAIAINEHKMDHVRRELRPFWARPALWAAVMVAVATAVMTV